MTGAAIAYALLSGVLLNGGTPDIAVPVQSHANCGDAGLFVDGDFEQAGFDTCTVDDSGNVVLHIRPETEPINPSPWYAARLTQPVLASRRVLLSYQGVRHRYHPWFSTDGRHWRQLTYEVAPESADRVSVSLPAFNGSAYLSAQPLVPISLVANYWAALAAEGRIALDMTATSTDGRPVPLYRRGPADAQVIHLVATRQHPPETTGAVAFDAFTAHLLASPQAENCSDQALLMAPMLNPDGLVRGHWRTNAGHIDTNRDWGTFATPEIRAVGQRIEALAESARIVSVLDFHSTRQGAIYVSRDSSPRAQAFASAVQDATGLRVVRTRSADGNTLKSWSENRLGSESFTVELPDSATPEEAAAAGRAIADLYVAHYLCPTGARP